MSLAAVFNTLGQDVMPLVAAAVFPDLLSITAETLVSDSGGGYSSSSTSTAYSSIPCAYEPLSGNRFDSAGKLVSTQAYKVTIPTHYDVAGTATRINLNPATHKLVVAARGNEPAKTFRIVAAPDEMGVIYEVLAEKEN
jgi:hypothetical protein